MTLIQVKQMDAPDDSRVILDSKMAHKIGIDTIPGSSYRGRGVNKWTLPRTFTSLTMLERTFPQQVTMEGQVATWFEAEKAKVAGIFHLIHEGLPGETRQKIQDKLLPDGFTARDHQIDGAVMLNAAGGAAMFDEQGMGKTLTIGMALMLYPNNYPALIICPKAVLWNWQRELRVLGIDSVVLHGTAAQRRKIISEFDPKVTPVMVTTYEMVKAHSRVAGYGNISLKKCVECGGKDPNIDIKKCEKHVRELNMFDWETVVVDEAQRIRFPKTPQTRAVWAVAEGARNRWALTGTPVESSPMEFWSILHFISPEEWPTSTKFRDRYLNVHTNYFGGIEILGIKADMLEEFKYLTGARWMRREHMNLPPVVEEYRYCELTPKERKAYKQMETQLMAQDADGNFLIAENHMVKQGRLMQLANSTVVIGTDNEVYPSEPSSKLDLFMDTIDEYIHDDEPVVVWFDHVGLLQMASARLEKAGKKHSVVYGNMSGKAVDAAVLDFQEGRSDCILLSQSKGGTGITLTRSRVSIHVEHNPSRILDSQTHGRTRRIGSEHHENILRIHLIAKDTVEEELVETSLPDKYEKAEEVLTR